MTKAVLDISALFEDTWTGIPNVVAAIAQRALEDQSIEWIFAYETIPIPRSVVLDFLTRHSGMGGLPFLADAAWNGQVIAEAEAKNLVAVFPNIKPVRRYFGREAIIVHDLSPILTPEFHNSDNIFHFANRIREDVKTSDHVFCVSQATLSDVNTYFKKPVSEMSVIRLGAEFDPYELSAGLQQLRPNIQVEPYIAVIGTLEPRKNGGILFEYLMQNPGFAYQYRIVFIGRDGWLDEKTRLLHRLEGVGVSPDRVQFTGYVSNAERTALMLNAAFCVYPSFFEGFGLPILEAGALGKITVCSNSSSMPEVMPGNCVFFNPQETFEFVEAMRTAELRAAQTRSRGQSLSDLLDRTSIFGWDECYQGVAKWVREQ
ncbi:glycosyltransferase family 4 protein [Brevundimonas aurantiaca]|uniref:glycosyltransferase family 4 protein n=1 Tax=Brevundimonas aurantiaca TaxID=74316 RepID=UPI00174C685E|nr:glycosyltransferase family 1 protein [Brevundimonas aurantiaca]